MRDKLEYLLKYQTGGALKARGISEKNLQQRFQSLVDAGIPNQAAFEISWQSLKENPKKYYSFGKNKPNLQSWTNDIIKHQLRRPIYKNAVKANNFDQYRQATKAYNTSPSYTNWLLQGRSEGKAIINNYIRDNQLGTPIAYQENNFTDNDFA